MLPVKQDGILQIKTRKNDSGKIWDHAPRDNNM